MAAGADAVSSGGRSSGSSAALEASLDRRLQGVSNTMESIQNLSTWCIENKKHNAVIVRYWMKWIRKSEVNHRLNLFYLANDIIQNCKRRNAIVYRSTFAEVLPDAALLVREGKVRKSVERIFNIWKERNVYPEELITELKANLQKKETPPPPPAPPKVPVTSKAALKAKIVAEFAPQAFLERLVAYKRSLDESDLRENQLSSLRVDVCSSEALKLLKDKAGGNVFAKEFEEGSTKLQEFVKFLQGQMQTGPALHEVLGNAEVFYQMQYKEVKIVANAYQTFANRVSNLKRKLDALKATLPDSEEPPVPSPLEDAPSPSSSASESSLQGLGHPQRTRDGKNSQDMEGVENMDVSDKEDTTKTSAVVEEKKEKMLPTVVSKASNATITKSPNVAPPAKTATEPAANQTTSSSSASTVTSPVRAAPLNLANVDLGKISSILSSLTNAMKNSGVSPSPVSRPSPGTPTTPSHTPTTKAPPITGGAAPNPLASILSKVDISPEGILNVLTKTNKHAGLSSLLTSARAGSLTSSNPAPSSSTVTTATTTTTSTVTPTTPSTPKTPKVSGSNSLTCNSEHKKVTDCERDKVKERKKENIRTPSLESKINSFLQGNPAFASVFQTESNSPLIVGGDATPVRDERGATPTQDEMIDSLTGHSHKTSTSPWDTEDRKDKDYRTPPLKSKELEAAKRRIEASPSRASTSSTSSSGQELNTKSKLEVRRTSVGPSNVGKIKEEKPGKRKEQAVAGDNERYRRIETVVTKVTSDNATAVETLGYSNRIQTVEGIRSVGRGPRRLSDASWYEEAEFMEATPPPHHGNHASESSGDLATPPVHLLPQYPPPPSPFFSSQPLPPSPVAHPLVAPPLLVPPPPPPPPRDFPPSPTVMMGGILVPLDRALALQHANAQPDMAGQGGGSSRGNGAIAPTLLRPLHRPLLGQHPIPSSPATPNAPMTPTSREPRGLLPSPTRALLNLPSPTQHLPLPLSCPREPLLPGAKRPGSAYQGGLLHTPKRPYMPPRY